MKGIVVMPVVRLNVMMNREKQKKLIKVGDLDNKFLDCSKLKAFADEKFNITQTLKFVLGWVENSVGN